MHEPDGQGSIYPCLQKDATRCGSMVANSTDPSVFLSFSFCRSHYRLCPLGPVLASVLDAEGTRDAGESGRSQVVGHRGARGKFRPRKFCSAQWKELSRGNQKTYPCDPAGTLFMWPPDGDRRVDPPVLSGRVPGLPSTPKDEAGLTRKFEASPVGHRIPRLSEAPWEVP